MLLTETDSRGAYGVSRVKPETIPMSDVSFIIVYVDDVARSEAFYASILGRGAVESSPTFAMLPAAPNLMLGLWKRDGVQPPASEAGGGEIAFTAANEAE